MVAELKAGGMAGTILLKAYHRLHCHTELICFHLLVLIYVIIINIRSKPRQPIAVHLLMPILAKLKAQVVSTFDLPPSL